jgi:propanol-preferring alcohol dehydrogenase
MVELPKPKPAAGEVLVRVHACGVCRTDLHVVEGELPPRKSPVVPGHQVVGVVEENGSHASRFQPGARVGIPWLHQTDGVCEYCRSGRENLCEHAVFTGWMVDGGYAEYVVAPEDFVYALPEGFHDLHAAPLLCAGIIGFRTLRRAAGWTPRHVWLRRRRARRPPGGALLEYRRLRHFPRPAPSQAGARSGRGVGRRIG